MRITSMKIYEVSIPLRFSFKHAKADRKKANNIIIILNTEKGATGYGEAIPREYLTGETMESIWDDIIEFWWPKLLKLDFSFTSPISEQLLPLYQEASRLGKTASYAAIDIAIHDAAAQTRGISIAQLLLIEENNQPLLTAPLGGNSIKSITRSAKFFKFLGFKEFKVKTGMSDDIAKVAAARSVIGKKAGLRVDSNQSWSFEKSVKLIPEVIREGVTLIEEPTADIEELALLNKTFNVDIMADETLCTYEDGIKLAEIGSASVWNLRLAKNGGFTGVLQLIKLAEKNNIKTHLGVLVGETSLLSEAALAIAGATDFIHIEFGFPKLLLKTDPFINHNTGYFGKPKKTGFKSGLEVKLNRNRLKDVMRKKAELSNGVFIPPKHENKSIFSQFSIFQK